MTAPVLTRLRRALHTVFVERQVPWALQRLWIYLRANHLRFVATKARFLVRPPKLRIVLSSHFLGGVGGTEKLVKSVIESMPDAEFHVMAGEVRFTGFYPETFNYYVNHRPDRNRTYDVYLYFCGGGRPKYLGNDYEFHTRVVDTNAARIHDIEHLFDHVLIQSTIWQNFTAQEEKCMLAFPDVHQTIPRTRSPVEGLPDKYLLTVFNPFSKTQKGQSVLFEHAPQSSLPIVWCFSDVSGWDFKSLPNTPNVIHLRNLTQEQLYYVYEHAAAYVSFAYYESYGWTLAEAFALQIPIIARETGIMPYIKAQAGIYIYENDDELSGLLKMNQFPRPNYDETFFVNNSYPAVLARLGRGA